MASSLLKRLDGATTLAQRLSLLTALFLAPIVILLLTLTVYAVRDIVFTEREVRGAALLERAWPGIAGEDQADIGQAGLEALSASAHDLGVDRELRTLIHARPGERAEAGAALVGAIADASNLTLDQDLGRFYLGDAASVGLPALWMGLGGLDQAAALPLDLPGRRERIVAAFERLNTQAGSLDQTLVKAIAHHPDTAARALIEGRRQDLAMARAGVLAQRDAAEAGVRPDLTRLRTAAGAAWGTTTDQLDVLVRRELDRLTIRFALALVLVAVSVAGALALTTAIHRGIIRRLDALIAPMSRLIAGDLDVEVPHLDQRNEFGRIAQTVLAFRESQVERARLEDEAAAAARAKSQFLANISHEIRTPLNGVIGAASALAATPLSPEQRRMVDLVRASGGEVERLMSDILDVARIDTGDLRLELASFDLAATMREAVEPLRVRAADKGLTLRLDLNAGAEGVFEGDPARLSQVVANLTTNAIKFTEAGEVVVSVAALPTEVPATRRLSVEVRDTGVGFDETLLPSLLEPFTQADGSLSRAHGGSGLGLPICRAIVELLGGVLEARSTRGKGSVFRFAVPLRDAAAAPTATVAAAVERPAKVLLVEDHEVNRAVVELLLAPLGVELVMARDGQEGVEVFQGDHFDLVLMDMQMPRLDGLAATRRLRDIEARRGAERTPIVMLTANVGPEHQLAALAAGADAHLAKPIDRERLWNVVIGGAAAA